MEKVKTLALNAAVVVLIALLLIWVNTWYRQQTQFLRGESAAARGDYLAALAGYEAAIHMYTPGSSLVEQSAQKLWAMAEGAERAGDQTRALITYRALRSSYYAVRWFTLPGREWITRCDAKIAALVKLQPQAAQQY